VAKLCRLSNNEADQTSWPCHSTRPSVVLTVPCSTDAMACHSSAEVYRRWRDVELAERRAAKYDDCDSPLQICFLVSPQLCVQWGRAVNRWTDAALDLQCWFRWPETASAVCSCDWQWMFQLVTARHDMAPCRSAHEPVSALCLFHRTASVGWCHVTSPAVDMTSLTVCMAEMCRTVTSAARASDLHRLTTLARHTSSQRHTWQTFVHRRRCPVARSSPRWWCLSVVDVL